MKIHSWPRRAGKTTVMLEWLHGTPNAVLIVATVDDEVRLRHRYLEMYPEDDGPDLVVQVIAATEFRRWQQGRLRPPFHVGVDDLDRVIAMLLGTGVTLATTTDNP